MGQEQSAAYAGNPENAPTMKAWVFERKGKMQDMKQTEVFVPRPEKGEVRVRIYAAGVNPVDCKRSQNANAEFPCIAGSDVSGVVDGIGEGVTHLHIGDRVHFHANVTKSYGAFAEYTITPADLVVKIPDGLSFTEAAAVPCSGWAAYMALYHKLRVRSGEIILITGAAGGVGSFAVQLAKLSGLIVVGLTSPHKMDYVRSLGADHVFPSTIDVNELYVRIDDLTHTRMVDHVLDVISPDSALKTLPYLKVNGNLCSLAGPVEGPEPMSRAVSVHYVNLLAMLMAPDALTHSVLTAVGTELSSLLVSRQIKVPLMEDCTFEQLPAAMSALAATSVQGKLVANVVPKSHHDQEYQKFVAQLAQASQPGSPASAHTPGSVQQLGFGGQYGGSVGVGGVVPQAQPPAVHHPHAQIPNMQHGHVPPLQGHGAPPVHGHGAPPVHVHVHTSAVPAPQYYQPPVAAVGGGAIVGGSPTLPHHHYHQTAAPAGAGGSPVVTSVVEQAVQQPPPPQKKGWFF